MQQFRLSHLALAVSLSLVVFSASAQGADQASKSKKGKKSEINMTSQSTPETVTTTSGLQYIDTKIGSGDSPKTGQQVTVHYTGTLKNGTKFDSSVDRGQPFTFVIGVGQVIKGWDEGVSTMKVGGKRMLIIPSKLGYGERGAGNVIPPNSELHFDVELLGIK